MAEKRKKSKKIILQNTKCPFGRDTHKIDYKDVYKLKKFITPRGRILPRSRTGVCMLCQRKLAKSVKRARFMALIPFVDYV